MSDNVIKLDIRPPASIYGTFSRLSYEPAYAIAEFVDNSTQSFYDKLTTMKFYKINKLKVNIEYDKTKGTLKIEDNAYGMDLTDFKLAILLGAKPVDSSGRNEFGMGLKTAASWFGNVWSVKSTRLNDDNEYFAEVNIPKLEDEGSNHIDIISSKTDKKKHGTTIFIKELTKKIKPTEVKKILSSTYRNDFKKDLVEIRFNGEILKFEPYSILQYKDNYWERQVDFKFEYDEKEYHITGKVGIIDPGGFSKAGFALFRRNRVIIGGEGRNYKPDKIFGQAQSQISLKLIGEFHLDDFEVNQAKDGFVWDGGLEDEFLIRLKENIQDYIKIAELSKKERIASESIKEDNSDIVHRETSKVLEKISKEIPEELIVVDEKDDDIKRYLQQELEKDRELKKEKGEISKERIYRNVIGSNDDIYIKWSIESNSKDWLDLTKIDNEEKKGGTIYHITMNLNHPFFKPYANEEGNEFKLILEKLAIAISLAEIQANRLADENGRVHPSLMVVLINQYLTELGNE